jgi:hypothetical protein
MSDQQLREQFEAWYRASHPYQNHDEWLEWYVDHYRVPATRHEYRAFKAGAAYAEKAAEERFNVQKRIISTVAESILSVYDSHLLSRDEAVALATKHVAQWLAHLESKRASPGGEGA